MTSAGITGGHKTLDVRLTVRPTGRCTSREIGGDVTGSHVTLSHLLNGFEEALNISDVYASRQPLVGMPNVETFYSVNVGKDVEIPKLRVLEVKARQKSDKSPLVM